MEELGSKQQQGEDTRTSLLWIASIARSSQLPSVREIWSMRSWCSTGMIGVTGAGSFCLGNMSRGTCGGGREGPLVRAVGGGLDKSGGKTLWVEE